MPRLGHLVDALGTAEALPMGLLAALWRRMGMGQLGGFLGPCHKSGNPKKLKGKGFQGRTPAVFLGWLMFDPYNGFLGVWLWSTRSEKGSLGPGDQKA